MKKKIFLLIIGLLIIGGIYIIASQSYPIALVNWQSISVYSFNKDFNAAINYYQKIIETYNKDQASIINSLETKQEIKRAILDKLIENNLIQQELNKRFKDKELGQMVANKIEKAMNGSASEKGVEVLYGFSLDEFKEEILAPQAKQEILEGRLFLENKNFTDWLKEAKKQAKVIILLPNLKWSETGVIIK